MVIANTNPAGAPGRATPPVSKTLATLQAQGYAVLPAIAEPYKLKGFATDLGRCFEAAPFSRGPFYGDTTKRFGRLLRRSPHAEYFACHPTILSLVEEMLGSPGRTQLNLTQAIEIHPGAPVQPPHRDHDMWAFPKTYGTTYMVNVMWTLDPFTAANGGTRIWPMSHAGDWSIMLPPDEDAVSVEAPAGSAILFLGQTLHSGGENYSDRPRRGAIFSYCLDWLLPDENPWLAYPPKDAANFSTALQALIGYRQRHAGLNNFEGRSPNILLRDRSAQDRFQPFTDDMSPEQEALIAQYYAERNARRAA